MVFLVYTTDFVTNICLVLVFGVFGKERGGGPIVVKIKIIKKKSRRANPKLLIRKTLPNFYFNIAFMQTMSKKKIQIGPS